MSGLLTSFVRWIKCFRTSHSIRDMSSDTKGFLLEILDVSTITSPPTEQQLRLPCPKRNATYSPRNDEGESFYRRELPEDLISFTSTKGRNIFKHALEKGTVENYFNLVGNFTTQTEPAYCGLGSLAMVLNALEVDPGRTWKGIWRWYSDEMLECCSPLGEVKEKGITIEAFVCLAQCHGLEAVERRFDKITLESFRNDLKATSTEAGNYMVVAFSREAMGQTGIGHFSPIGAYHEESDMALVLDVARFKYPSYWAPVEKLWNSMAPLDPDSNLPRGYIMLRSNKGSQFGH